MSDSKVVHVIDDDVDVRQSLAFLLSAAGLAVRTHDSAVAFLKALPTLQDGCIVTDIRMPEMDGLELQKRLKEMKIDMPVIVITGHGTNGPHLAVRTMKLGADDYVTKPFGVHELLARVEALLRHSQTNTQTWWTRR